MSRSRSRLLAVGLLAPVLALASPDATAGRKDGGGTAQGAAGPHGHGGRRAGEGAGLAAGAGGVDLVAVGSGREDRDPAAPPAARGLLREAHPP